MGVGIVFFFFLTIRNTYKDSNSRPAISRATTHSTCSSRPAFSLLTVVKAEEHKETVWITLCFEGNSVQRMVVFCDDSTVLDDSFSNISLQFDDQFDDS